jgi:hypothetical protein
MRAVPSVDYTMYASPSSASSPSPLPPSLSCRPRASGAGDPKRRRSPRATSSLPPRSPTPTCLSSTIRTERPHNDLQNRNALRRAAFRKSRHRLSAPPASIRRRKRLPRFGERMKRRGEARFRPEGLSRAPPKAARISAITWLQPPTLSSGPRRLFARRRPSRNFRNAFLPRSEHVGRRKIASPHSPNASEISRAPFPVSARSSPNRERVGAQRASPPKFPRRLSPAGKPVRIPGETWCHLAQACARPGEMGCHPAQA